MSAAKKVKIVVIDYGMGNIHSILKALDMYHSPVHFSGDVDHIASADALVLPGDGAFPRAMQNLSDGKDQAILAHVKAGKPLLGVCIGFQVLFEDSTEVDIEDAGSHTPGASAPAIPTSTGASTMAAIRGLSVFQGKIRKFPVHEGRRIPHMGWNRLEAASGYNAPYWNDYMYFIHSYRAEGVRPQDVVAWCDYDGERFPAAVRRDNVLATQFHPEKSDRGGLVLLKDWIASIE